MPESILEVLKDIRHKLSTGCYKNEEQVRFSLVGRVVHVLGWDTWNPKEVTCEYTVAPDEDRTKVDMALFARDDYPAVLIEIKAVGRINGNLDIIETQVRNYNRDITAPFSIITDGQIWRFYYVKGEGTFSQKLFDELSIADPNEFQTAETFESYLKKEKVKNGTAEDLAKRKLKVTQKHDSMANSYEEAETRTRQEPFPSLPEALIDVMRQKGFEITRQEAVTFIRSRSPEPENPREPSLAVQQPRTNTTQINQREGNRERTPEICAISVRELVSKLIQIIKDHGGSVSRYQIRQEMYSEFRQKFEHPYWQARVANGIPRWQHNGVAWKIEQAKRDGLIEKTDQRGYWQLTEKGWKYK